MLYKKCLLRGLLAAALVNAVALGGAARADEYDDLRARWSARGGASDAGDPDVAAQIAASQASAQQLWDTLNRSPARTALWPNLTNFAASATITSSFTRLGQLADAYYNGNASLRGNPDVLAEVLAGLDWLVANYYNTGVTEFDNWWDWQIGTPQALLNIVHRTYNDMSAAQRATLLSVVDRFVPDPARRLNRDGTFMTNVVETGANLLDKAFVLVMRGMLGKDGDKLAVGRNAISPALPYVTTGDGFYADGSFVQHLHYPYVGGYGGPLLVDIGRMYYLLDGSPWEVTDANKGVVFDWAMKAYRPFIYDGAMMDSQRGRSISRQNAPDHLAGKLYVANLLSLTDSLPAGQAGEIRSVLKGWMQRDTAFGSSYFNALQIGSANYSALSASEITRLKAILNDAAIAAAPEPVETRVYAAGDRVVQRRPGHAFVLSMFSKRMGAFESGNGENVNGWWTGMGMTTLYNADQTQYMGNYWATTDMWRLPGTTTDHSSGTLVAWKFYGNTRAGVGGAQLDNLYAAAGMDFATLNVTGSTLSGKKAWFLFGDKVVAVGAGISSTDGRAVETIVENRKLGEDGINPLTVNGSEKEAFIPWAEDMPAVGWAHLAGNVIGADIGYVFPDAPVVAGLRERRSGKWRDVNITGSTADVEDNYLSLALSHGTNPANAAYTYIVLPNRSAAETAAIAANPGIAVLERSTSATAVKDTAQGVTGLVFWNDSSKTVSAGGQPLVTSDRKSVVMLKQAGTELKVSVADPTQVYTGNLNIDINRAALSVVSADPGVTVLQTSPAIKLRVAVSGSAGRSYGAQFALSSLLALAPAADAYVRDGASATANFGATGTVTVKADAVGFARKGLFKFDLSSVEGTIASASLRLTPVVVGMAGVSHNLYLTDGASWEEGTVTWNNRPANGALAASWALPAVNTQVQVDVSSQAIAAMGGNKLLSFGVEAAQNYGANGSVDYASRTHANISYRPTLVVTLQ